MPAPHPQRLRTSPSRPCTAGLLWPAPPLCATCTEGATATIRREQNMTYSINSLYSFGLLWPACCFATPARMKIAVEYERSMCSLLICIAHPQRATADLTASMLPNPHVPTNTQPTHATRPLITHTHACTHARAHTHTNTHTRVPTTTHTHVYPHTTHTF